MSWPITQGQWEVTKIIHIDEEKEVVYFKSNKESIFESRFYSIRYDGTDLKATIGSYPINNYTSGKNYAEGKIYKVSVYKKALNKNQILHNYLQGAEDFDTTNNAAINVSTSASSSSGGY